MNRCIVDIIFIKYFIAFLNIPTPHLIFKAFKNFVQTKY